MPLTGVRETDGDEAPGLALDALQATMLEEFRGLRKTLRKQSQAVEAVRDRLDAATEPRRNEQNGEELRRMAPPKHNTRLEKVVDQLEELCREAVSGQSWTSPPVED